jgi:hypothetical protein
LTNTGLLRFRRSDGSVFQLPYDLDSIEEAEKGDYREKETGNIITDPNFIATWDIYVENTDDILKYKQDGFIPPE